jgi:hypothetical protein
MPQKQDPSHVMLAHWIKCKFDLQLAPDIAGPVSAGVAEVSTISVPTGDAQDLQ